MKKVIKLLTILLTLILCVTATSCSTTVHVHATIAFKTNGANGKYSEAIEEFEIGKPFYTAVEVNAETNKKSEKDFTVQIEVPKTKDVTVDNRGGLDAFEVKEDLDKGLTILKYNIKGKQNSVKEKMLFRGVPYEEGTAKIKVSFYDNESGEKLDQSYSMTIYFVYEVNN